MKRKEIKKLLGVTYGGYGQFQKEIKNNTGKTNNKLQETDSIVYYKSYARFEEIKLPKENLKNISLKKVLEDRYSQRLFEESSISLTTLSTILKYSIGINQSRKKKGSMSFRYYPSAGGRFPIEAYVIVNKVKSLARGVYHYYLPNHSLEKLFNNIEFNSSDLFVSPWFEKASCFIVLTAIPLRTTSKYSNLGYRFVLNEAGFAGQNIYLVSQAMNIGCSAASYYDDKLESLIGIDGKNESIVLAFAIGNRKRGQG